MQSQKIVLRAALAFEFMGKQATEFGHGQVEPAAAMRVEAG